MGNYPVGQSPMGQEAKKKEKDKGFWSKMFGNHKEKEKEKERQLKEQAKNKIIAKGQHNTAMTTQYNPSKPNMFD